MRFKNWLANEAWAPQTSQKNRLSGYLSNPKHSVLDVWHHFTSWNRAQDITHELGLSLQDLRNDDLMYDNAEKIDSYMDEHPELWDRLHSYVTAREPSEAPTLTHVSPAKQLPRNTWLVHFSDHAPDISSGGFRLGEPDVTRLGLTSFRKPTMPGYNFAFVAGSRYSRDAAESSKYGSDAVMFMAPAHLVHHHGDEEDQAIFDGESVRPKDIVLLTKDGENSWTVNSKKRGVRDPFRSDDFEKAEAWVMDNWEQYKKIIMS